jgi:hypothetical protein
LPNSQPWMLLFCSTLTVYCAAEGRAALYTFNALSRGERAGNLHALRERDVELAC